MKTAFIIIIVMVGVFYLIGSYEPGSSEIPDVKNFSLTQEAFNPGCMDGALAEGNVTKAQAETYCTCLYRNGVDEYGAVKFTDEVTELGRTNTLTPKLNELVNKCINYTLETEGV